MGLGPVIGHGCKLYYNSATNASPTWVEIDEIGDLDVSDMSWSEAELKLRLSIWVKSLPAMLSASIEFSLLYRGEATVFEALRTAWLAKTPYQYAVADGAIATAGTHALKIYCYIQAFPLTQPLEGVAMVEKCRLKPAHFVESDAIIEPAWMIVSSG